IRVSVNGAQGRAVAVIPVSTGQSTAQSGLNYTAIALWVLAIGLVVFVVVRMRKTGQRVGIKGMFSASVLWSLLLLGAAFAAAIYAMNHYRRPGSMTPLEAQGMEMSTRPTGGS